MRKVLHQEFYDFFVTKNHKVYFIQFIYTGLNIQKKALSEVFSVFLLRNITIFTKNTANGAINFLRIVKERVQIICEVCVRKCGKKWQ